MTATHFFLVTAIHGRSGELVGAEKIETFNEAVEIFRSVDDAVRIIEIDIAAGTSKDRTRDALVIFANRSFNEADPIHYELAGLCDLHGVHYFREREVYDYV